MTPCGRHSVIPGTPYSILDLEEREESSFDMACLARVVASGLPHHIAQRGNRRQETLFCTEDYKECIALMREWSRGSAVEV